MDTFQQNIKDTLTNAPSSVHAIFYGLKTKNGELTDKNSLVFFVEKKLPLNQVPKDQLIPEKINFEEKEYETDVVQYKKFILNQCYTLTDSEVVSLQTKTRPLSGGLEISNLASWNQELPYVFNYTVGTLGFIAVDNLDNTLVGVTNSHVIVSDAFICSERNPANPPSSIIDDVVFNSPTGLNTSYKPSVLQFNSVKGTVNFSTDSIGMPKRYVPISEYDANTADAALISLKSGTTNSSSAQQAQLANSYAMPFATTAELDDLYVNNIPLYSVGRSTGPKGINCPLVVYGSGAVLIDFNKNDNPTPVVMADVIIYKFLDGSNLPIYIGDSGSAVVGDFNGTYKIVGLAFAGDTNLDTYNPTSSYALACRIDHVASQLNISAWDGTNLNFSNNNVSQIYTQFGDSRPYITYNGKTYYQAGSVINSKNFTNI